MIQHEENQFRQLHKYENTWPNNYMSTTMLWSFLYHLKKNRRGKARITQTLITSWDAIPPMKAATAWSSAAPNRHISLIRSSVKVTPLQPKSLRRPTAVVFNRDMSSSITLKGKWACRNQYTITHLYSKWPLTLNSIRSYPSNCPGKLL